MGRIRSGRWAFGFTVGAFSWALALIPTAFLLPVYGTETITDAFPPAAGKPVVSMHHGDATLIGVNGVSIRLLILLALPAALAAIAWVGLHRTCAHGSFTGKRIATAAIGVLGCLTVLTGLSIGGAILPVLVLLLIARTLTPCDGRQAAV